MVSKTFRAFRHARIENEAALKIVIKNNTAKLNSGKSDVIDKSLYQKPIGIINPKNNPNFSSLDQEISSGSSNNKRKLEETVPSSSSSSDKRIKSSDKMSIENLLCDDTFPAKSMVEPSEVRSLFSVDFMIDYP